jgi:hypothetical protein
MLWVAQVVNEDNGTFTLALYPAPPPNEDINNMRQNHPELVVKDIMAYFGTEKEEDAQAIRRILKNRGINKWLRVRRFLIQLKAVWCRDIAQLEDDKQYLGAACASLQKTQPYGRRVAKRLHYLRGYCEALKDCRQQVRALCHSPRDVDFPKSGFGDVCKLPNNLPMRPHKRWFWKHDKGEA